MSSARSNKSCDEPMPLLAESPSYNKSHTCYKPSISPRQTRTILTRDQEVLVSEMSSKPRQTRQVSGTDCEALPSRSSTQIKVRIVHSSNYRHYSTVGLFLFSLFFLDSSTYFTCNLRSGAGPARLSAHRISRTFDRAQIFNPLHFDTELPEHD